MNTQSTNTKPDLATAAEMLWTVVANVRDWKEQSPEWQAAAEKWRNYYFTWRDRHLEAERTRPRIICICGSSSFVDVAAVKAWEFQKQGLITLGMQLLPKWYTGVQDHHQAGAEGVSKTLDDLFLKMIDLADRVYVVNKGGYIGERTQIEIEYARSKGRVIEYMEAPEPITGSRNDGGESGLSTPKTSMRFEAEIKSLIADMRLSWMTDTQFEELQAMVIKVAAPQLNDAMENAAAAGIGKEALLGIARIIIKEMFV